MIESGFDDDDVSISVIVTVKIESGFDDDMYQYQ
jgi:hypothetical protein